MLSPLTFGRGDPSRQHAEQEVNSPQSDGVIRAVLVDPGAEAGAAECAGSAF